VSVIDLDDEAAPAGARPLPQPDNVSAELWAAAARGDLLIQRCPDCGHAQFSTRALCTRCAPVPAWELASGEGAVHTFTVSTRTWHRPSPPSAPTWWPWSSWPTVPG
jgi:uncharacterized OB-fold protein